MILATPKLYLSNDALLRSEVSRLLESPNAMSAFAYDAKILPDSTYLRVFNYKQNFLGAVHLEAEEFDKRIVNIHPMILERDRDVFTQTTEAAILWCILTGKIPTATVMNIDRYEYMHLFLQSLGFISHARREWLVYRLPVDWKPKAFPTFTVKY